MQLSGSGIIPQSKGHQLDSRSGHMPMLCAWSLVRTCAREATDWCFFLTWMFLFLLFSFPSPLSKRKRKRKKGISGKKKISMVKEVMEHFVLCLLRKSPGTWVWEVLFLRNLIRLVEAGVSHSSFTKTALLSWTTVNLMFLHLGIPVPEYVFHPPQSPDYCVIWDLLMFLLNFSFKPSWSRQQDCF